jgi:Ca2+/H+ antiporter
VSAVSLFAQAGQAGFAPELVRRTVYATVMLIIGEALIAGGSKRRKTYACVRIRSE